jgi:hypothetical protein
MVSWGLGVIREKSFFFLIFFWAIFSFFCSYNIQHCFICRPSDATVPTDAGIEPRTVAKSHPQIREKSMKFNYTAAFFSLSKTGSGSGFGYKVFISR